MSKTKLPHSCRQEVFHKLTLHLRSQFRSNKNMLELINRKCGSSDDCSICICGSLKAISSCLFYISSHLSFLVLYLHTRISNNINQSAVRMLQIKQRRLYWFCMLCACERKYSFTLIFFNLMSNFQVLKNV